MKCSLKNKRILITCGPTAVPIDAMRIISNLSSGTLGQMIACDFAKAGARVTLLEGPVAQPLISKSVNIRKFMFFDEFNTLIQKEVKKTYHACIHAAAVSDYKIKKPWPGKLSSQLKTVTLTLVPTQKIIDQIKRLNPNLFLVGFKLESNLTEASAKRKTRKLFQTSRCDLVVANSLKGGRYTGYVLGPGGKFLGAAKSRKALSETLVRLTKKSLLEKSL